MTQTSQNSCSLQPTLPLSQPLRKTYTANQTASRQLPASSTASQTAPSQRHSRTDSSQTAPQPLVQTCQLNSQLHSQPHSQLHSQPEAPNQRHSLSGSSRELHPRRQQQAAPLRQLSTCQATKASQLQPLACHSCRRLKQPLATQPGQSQPAATRPHSLDGAWPFSSTIVVKPKEKPRK